MNTLLQYGTTEQQQILNLSVPINKAYAAKYGFQHLVDNTVRCADRAFYWEKIAYINSVLPTLDNGSLVVWVDADSLCIGNEDLNNIMPSSAILGMVPLRGGLGGKKVVNWYNSGTIAMINSPAVQTFFINVFNLNTTKDEDAIMEQLKLCAYNVGNVPIFNLDPKWNGWLNNVAICPNPVIKTFHGLKMADKLTQMTTLIAGLQTN